MAAEATITRELAFEVANKIEAGGKTPTLETLRAALAEATGTKGGSFATLAPFLRAWKEQKSAAAATEPLREAAPPVIADRLHGWAADVWSAALDLANTRLAAEREALDQARTKLETDVADGLALADHLSSQRDELEARCIRLEADLDQAQAALADEQTKHRDVSASLQICQAEAKQRAEQIEDLRREAKSAHEERVELTAQVREAQSELATKFGEITVLRTTLATAEEARAHAVRDVSAAEERARLQLETADLNVREARGLASQVGKEAAQARDEAAVLRGKVEAMESQLTQLAGVLSKRSEDPN